MLPLSTGTPPRSEAVQGTGAGGGNGAMADVRIETTNDLPDPIGFAVEFGPGFIHVAMRPDADAGAVMCEAVTAVIDCYPIEETA